MISVLPTGVPGSWAIYDEDGNEAVPFDTFMGCTVKHEHKAAQNAVEMGGFVDYNKTAKPVEVGIVLAKSGSPSDLTAMLDALDALVAGTDLVSIVTPEKTFVDFNLTGYDYDRKTENGVDRLLVSLKLEEIRQVEAEYSNEQIPPVESPKQAGDKSTRQAGKQTASQATPETKNKTRERFKKYDSQAARRTNIGK